jgi:hypothetical protein
MENKIDIVNMLNDNPLISGHIENGYKYFSNIILHLSNPKSYKDSIKFFLAELQQNYEDIWNNSQFFLRKYEVDELMKLNLDNDVDIMKLIDKLLGNQYTKGVLFNNQSIVYCKLFWLCVYLKSNSPFREVLKSNINNRETYLSLLYFSKEQNYKLYFNFCLIL